MANNVTLSYPSAFHHQFLDLNGKPLTGGKLYTYSAGTSTPVPTYKTIGDTSSTNTNTNPIILDNAGMAYIVIETDKAYKFVLFDKNDAKIAEWDNVTGNIGGGGGSSEDIVVVGTPNEIDVSGSVTQGVKRYVISLSNSVKSTILYLVGLYTNVLNSLGNKADKVQGATAGNLAALDASGNLTDSGSKVADFKTKQTPVYDPSASGAGLEFIDSISQDANGEITPHKKSVQDGTTAQKGVVKLSNAIDSTSVTEAATPKAVKDAYDELNNKIVARAVFLSQAEWAVQSQLEGDPAKVYYVENGTGEDAYTVYVWKESTSTYEEVDESSIDLDGYWHDGPTTTGSGNVVTNITLGNDGVPQVEKGMSAEPAFSVLPIAKGGTGADTIKGALSTLTSEMQHYDSGPTDDSLFVLKFIMPNASNGALYTRKLSYLWTYIQNKIISVLGLTASSYSGNAATATSATTATNYASGGGIDTALQGKLGTSGNGSNVSVTPDGTSTGYDLGSSTTLKAFAQKFKNLVSALKALAFKDKVSDSDINGTISDSHIASASTWNGKQNALPTSGSASSTYAINISGKSSASDSLDTKYTDLTNFDDFVPSVGKVVQYSINGSYTNGPSGAASSGYWGILQVFWRNACPYQMFFNSINMWIRYTTTQTGDRWTNWNSWTLVNSDASSITSGTFDPARIPAGFVKHGSSQVGSSTTPVYVDSNGQVQPCDVLSGGTSNFNRTFTTTYTVGSTDQYITTLIKNDNTDLIADYVAWHNANYGKLSSPPMIIISVSARDTNVANAGLISLNMYRTGNGCDVFGEKYAYMGNQHGSQAYNTQYFTDQTFVSGSAYYLNIRNETQNTMWAAGTILDISIRIVAHAVSVT